MDEIRNKVAESGIVTLDINDFRPAGTQCSIDIGPVLWEGLVLKEKDYRDWIKSIDWSSYADKHVAVHCSADAVIPSWAYMLLAVHIEPHAQSLFYGTEVELSEQRFKAAIEALDMSPYQDKRVMLKGCGDSVPVGSYLYLTARLRPVVKSLMFGEPCSAVPVYKAK